MERLSCRSSLPSEESPDPMTASSEPQQLQCQASSPGSISSRKYVYHQPMVSSDATSAAHNWWADSGDYTGENDDSGYGCGHILYLPAMEALERE